MYLGEILRIPRSRHSIHRGDGLRHVPLVHCVSFLSSLDYRTEAQAKAQVVAPEPRGEPVAVGGTAVPAAVAEPAAAP